MHVHCHIALCLFFFYNLRRCVSYNADCSSLTFGHCPLVATYFFPTTKRETTCWIFFVPLLINMSPSIDLWLCWVKELPPGAEAERQETRLFSLSFIFSLSLSLSLLASSRLYNTLCKTFGIISPSRRAFSWRGSMVGRIGRPVAMAACI